MFTHEFHFPLNPLLFLLLLFQAFAILNNKNEDILKSQSRLSDVITL